MVFDISELARTKECGTSISTLYRDYPGALYNLVEESGPPHDKQYIFNVNINGNEYSGTGKTKKLAKQAAAGAALMTLNSKEATTPWTVVQEDEHQPVSRECQS